MTSIQVVYKIPGAVLKTQPRTLLVIIHAEKHDYANMGINKKDKAANQQRIQVNCISTTR